jgi:hypothetical protein
MFVVFCARKSKHSLLKRRSYHEPQQGAAVAVVDVDGE